MTCKSEYIMILFYLVENNIHDLKEKKKHGNSFFHFSVYDNNETFPDMAPHWHDEFEILYCIKGHVTLRINENEYDFKEGQAVFVPCGLIHSSDSGNLPFLFKAIVFDTDILSSDPADLCKINYLDPVKKHGIQYSLHIYGKKKWETEIINRIKNLIEIYDEKQLGFELGIKGELNNIFFKLVSNNPVRNSCDKKKEAEINRIKNTIIYIRNNYSKKLSIEEMAEKCNMSIYYFCHFFKRVIGKAPINFLNNYRIQKACVLIKETDKTISEIAYNAGFNDSSYFSKIFQKYQNCTPTEYRNNKF